MMFREISLRLLKYAKPQLVNGGNHLPRNGDRERKDLNANKNKE